MDVPGPGEEAMAFVSVKVALPSARVGLSSPKVEFVVFVFALEFATTDGEVRSKWARFICSSSFLGHVDVKSHRRHWNFKKESDL